MKIDLIKIGNSQGLRIPTTILKQCNVEKSLDLTVEGENIVLRPIKNPREGWREAFSDMHKNEDDKLLVDDTLDVLEDWTW